MAKKKVGRRFTYGPKGRARGKAGTKPMPDQGPPTPPKEHIGTTIGKAGKALSGAGVPVEDWFK